MADTVVQYVINISAQNAEKSLDRLGKESQQVSTEMTQMSQEARQASSSLDNLGRESKRLDNSLKKTETQARSTTKSFRNMRKAGRDLDGAFADIGQGLSLISPQLGGVFQTLSDGASITEGLSRTLVGALNPAMAGVLAVTAALGGAIYLYTESQREAEEQARLMKEAIDTANKAIEDQENILRSVQGEFGGYIIELNDARNQMALLSGDVTELDALQAQASQRAERARQKALDTNSKELEAIQKIITEQENLLAIAQKSDLEFRSMLDTRQRMGQRRFQEEGEEDQEKRLAREVELAQQALDATIEKRRANQGNIQNIERQADELERVLQRNIEIREEQRQADKDERDREKRRAEARKKQREDERELNKELQEQERLRLSALTAQERLEGILNKAITAQLSKREQIIAKFTEQIELVDSLGEKSGDYNLALEATFALLAQQNKELEEYDKKQIRNVKTEEEKLYIYQAQRLELSEINKLLAGLASETLLDFKINIEEQFGDGIAIGLLRAIDPALGEIGSTVQSVLSTAIEAVGTLATGSLSSMVSMFAPIFGQALGILSDIGKKTPEERKQELLEEIEAIKLGLEYFPEIFLSVLPQMAIALTEAIYDGTIRAFQNLLELIADSFSNLFSFRDRSPDGDNETLRERAGDFLRDFFDPSKSASFASGGRFIPSAQGGIRFTGMNDGLAQLHRGEFVVPQSGQRPQQVDRQLNQQGGGMNITINSLVTEQNAIDSLVRQIENRFNNSYGQSSSNLFGGR